MHNAVVSAALATVGQAIDDRAGAAVAACQPAELAEVLDTLADLAARGEPGAQTALERTAAAVDASGRGAELVAFRDRAAATGAARAAALALHDDDDDTRPPSGDTSLDSPDTNGAPGNQF
jgi:hypothetical protein